MSKLKQNVSIWINLTNIILSQKSKWQKNINNRILFI